MLVDPRETCGTSGVTHKRKAIEMKEGLYENECDEVDGLTIEQAEGLARSRLIYPEFRILFVTISDQLKLLIEVHVAELGEESDFFACTVSAEYFADTPDHKFELILEPMLLRLNKDILSAALERRSGVNRRLGPASGGPLGDHATYGVEP